MPPQASHDGFAQESHHALLPLLVCTHFFKITLSFFIY